jgi:Utp21 specific WD40 associated putative domain
MEAGLKTKCEFELFQAYLLAFLRIHGDSLAGMPELNVVQTVKDLWATIEGDFMYSLCMIDFARRAQY